MLEIFGSMAFGAFIALFSFMIGFALGVKGCKAARGEEDGEDT